MLAMMLDEDGDDDFVVLMVLLLYIHASAWRRFDCRMPYF